MPAGLSAAAAQLDSDFFVRGARSVLRQCRFCMRPTNVSLGSTDRNFIRTLFSDFSKISFSNRSPSSIIRGKPGWFCWC